MSDQETGKLSSPALVPVLLITLSGHLLPGGSLRDRYRQEFLSELYGMSRGRQTVHALQIMASTWSLRSAAKYPRREGHNMLSILRRKPPLCLLNVRHHWETESSPDGERYQRCSKCGKDRMDYPWGLDPKGHNTIGA